MRKRAGVWLYATESVEVLS